jgi:hypothetical protein
VGRIGFVLLALGFLAATYVASLSPTEVNWLFFAPAVAVAAAGVLMIRSARSAAARDSTVLKDNLAALDRSLASINANLDKLRAGASQLPGHQLRFEIDRLFRDDLRAFADARETITHLFGLRVYGDVMSAFAAGERYMNRIWSASADGYEEEARAYIDRAHAQFVEARAVFDRARSTSKAA